MVLVKLLRTGLGLTSETIHAARDRPSSSDQPSFTSPPPYTTSAIDTVENAEIPVQNAQVENSINRNIEHQQSNAPQTARDSPPDYLDTYDQDEAIWQLDDMAESVREQPHDETMATVTPDQQETEEEKIKQREALARELVATAGPVPAQYNVFLAQSSFLNAGLEIRIAGSCVRLKFKGAGNWVNDYMDRRAAVFYEAKHPGTPLVQPAEQRKPMKTRFNDPNHPANSGSITSLVTGGHVPVPGKNKLHKKRNEKLGVNSLLRRSVDPSRDGRLISGAGRQFVKKKLQKDVLYLLIVNLPTAAEEREARELDARLGGMMEQPGAGGP
ncbi:hypothetical protein SI65_00612 [Aspergillus cristatus]|uniref:Uncharacterized protein n=1 Tax=Aspergillus cristatus TaxID=573508 RepID=A0A1E3BPX1_ASPCR|nr:hypothetical protein SI65_00612 [Aspergillus cristatus]